MLFNAVAAWVAVQIYEVEFKQTKNQHEKQWQEQGIGVNRQ